MNPHAAENSVARNPASAKRQKLQLRRNKKSCFRKLLLERFEDRRLLAGAVPELEPNDTDYANDAIAGANALSLTHGAPGHLVARGAGTIMLPEGSNTDEDVFSLGTLSAGNVVELSTSLPSTSTVVGRVRLINASGAAVADTGGNLVDGHFSGTIPADGAYSAKLESLWTYSGHTYLVTEGNLAWTAAESYAQGLGGHLATINDAAEQAWVQGRFGGLLPVWIEMTDQAAEGTWV
jgi:hypothetical protein